MYPVETKKEYRGQGIGTQLMKMMKNILWCADYERDE